MDYFARLKGRSSSDRVIDSFSVPNSAATSFSQRQKEFAYTDKKTIIPVQRH
jgi:hypothetical protein